MPHEHIPTIQIPAMLLIVLMSGCQDQRAVELAREAAERQAQQNNTMAELNQEVASGAKRLVETDAQARREIVGVHRDLQAERTRLDSGWNSLEHERKQIARQRRVESLLVPAITTSGGILLLAILLGFCWQALFAARGSDDNDAPLNELLVSELLGEASPPLTAIRHAPSLLGRSDHRSAE